MTVRILFFIALFLLPSCSDSDGGGGHPNGTCADTACGGDPVGVWNLVTYCGPDYVVGVAQTVTFSDDGTYSYTSEFSGNSYSGTWEKSGEQIDITVSGSTSHAQYCVGDNLFWWSSGGLTVVRSRDGSPTPTPIPR